MYKVLKILLVIVFVFSIFSGVVFAASASVRSFGGKITKIEKLNEGEYKCDNNGSIVTIRTRVGIATYFISSSTRPVTRNELRENRAILGNRKIEPTVITCKKKDDDKQKKEYVVPAIVYFGLSNR